MKVLLRAHSYRLYRVLTWRLNPIWKLSWKMKVLLLIHSDSLQWVLTLTARAYTEIFLKDGSPPDGSLWQPIMVSHSDAESLHRDSPKRWKSSWWLTSIAYSWSTPWWLGPTRRPSYNTKVPWWLTSTTDEGFSSWRLKPTLTTYNRFSLSAYSNFTLTIVNGNFPGGITLKLIGSP